MACKVVYSPLCNTDPELYRQYLSACKIRISNGRRAGRLYGGRQGVRPDLPVSVGAARRLLHGGRSSVEPAKIGGRDDIGQRVGQVLADSLSDGDPRSSKGLLPEGSGAQGAVDGTVVGDCEPGAGSRKLGPKGGLSVGRGPNYEKNEVRRKRWQERKREVREVTGVVGEVEKKGFWNTCSSDVRQELIDTKARMHIAENKRRTAEAEARVTYLESPMAILERAMGAVKVAEEAAKKQRNKKVAGWAATVASTYAESVAKSAPSSVPSFKSRSSETSVSVDGEVRGKPVEATLSRTVVTPVLPLKMGKVLVSGATRPVAKSGSEPLIGVGVPIPRPYPLAEGDKTVPEWMASAKTATTEAACEDILDAMRTTTIVGQERFLIVQAAQRRIRELKSARRRVIDV